MARGINKAIIVGNLGNDPDVKMTTGGSPVANLSVATSEAWKDKNTGQMQERTEWHRIVFFGRQAEICQQYLRKGSKIYVEGRIQTRKWTDNNGQDRYSTEIIGNEMQMLDSRGEGGQGGGFSNNAGGGFNNAAGGFSQPQQTQSFAPQPQTQKQPSQNFQVPNDSDFDDDIPF